MCLVHLPPILGVELSFPVMSFVHLHSILGVGLPSPIVVLEITHHSRLAMCTWTGSWIVIPSHVISPPARPCRSSMPSFRPNIDPCENKSRPLETLRRPKHSKWLRFFSSEPFCFGMRFSSLYMKKYLDLVFVAWCGHAAMPQTDRQTDRQTDIQTDEHTCKQTDG